LISIPAGLSKMSFGVFSFYTFLGAAMWSTVLVALGYFLGEEEGLIKEYLHQLVYLSLGLVTLISVIYIYIQKKKKS